MSKFYVERQCWQRWPRVLVMCKDAGNGIERRRYVYEAEEKMYWQVVEQQVNDLIHEIEKRDELIRDLLRWMPCPANCRICERFRWPEGCEFEQRRRDMGIDLEEVEP